MQQSTRSLIWKLLFCLGLVVLTLLAYGELGSHQFLNYDDPGYVTANPMVQQGLTWEGVRWAFTTSHLSNWHPLTWISHMLDCQWFGPRPGAHLQVNLLLHLVNSLLLCFLLQRLTGQFWPGAFVAGLFALHPMNVESVAWVSERKNLLSALFWFLTTWAYIGYVRRPKPAAYAAVLLLFALGLMTKPMLVTLPLVLLLLDYWPLGRLQLAPGAAASPAPRKGALETAASALAPRPFGRLVLEKAPLLALAAASCVVTLLTARTDGALQSADQFPLGARLGNAVVAPVIYIGKLLVPENLAVLYPHPGFRPGWQVAGAAVLLVVASLWVVLFWRSRPHLLVGWLWYLITLVPVIGLVQVGFQATANRYVYLPYIGLFILVAWSARGLLSTWRVRPAALAGAGALVLIACGLLTLGEVRNWRDSVTLFTRALAVTTDNAVAHYNLGEALTTRGQLEESMAHYREAIRIKPDYPSAHNNLGVALVQSGNAREATNHYAHAIRLLPDNADFHVNYGIALTQLGLLDAAIAEHTLALRSLPDDPYVHVQLAIALARKGRADEALQHFRDAARLQPEALYIYLDAGRALREAGRAADAVGFLQQLIQRRPDSVDGRGELALALEQAGKLSETVEQAREILKLQPDSARALNNLAWLLATLPTAELRNGREAVKLAERACQLTRQQQPVFLGTLAAAQAEAGNFDAAMQAAQQAATLAQNLGQTNLASTNLVLLKLYEAGKPYHRGSP